MNSWLFDGQPWDSFDLLGGGAYGRACLRILGTAISILRHPTFVIERTCLGTCTKLYYLFNKAYTIHVCAIYLLKTLLLAILDITGSQTLT